MFDVDVLVIVADVAAQSAFVEHQSGELATALASLGPFGTVGVQVDARVVVSGGIGGRVAVAVAGRYDPRGTYAVILVVGIIAAFVVGRIVGWGSSRCGDAEVGRCGNGDCCY